MMNRKRLTYVIGILSVGIASVLFLMSFPIITSANEGIEIRPDADGSFIYEDDYQTPRFLMDSFVNQYRPEIWQPGSIRNQGPGNWSLVYRFFGDRTIENVDVLIQQAANGRNLGGYNNIYVSPNGLDWHHATGSSTIKPGRGMWQEGPLKVNNEQVDTILDGRQFWLRLDLNNISGLSTNTSSSISNLQVVLKLGDSVATANDSQSALVEQWGKLRASSGWRSIALDAADPVDQRPSYYLEDVDGWLRDPGELAYFAVDNEDGFVVQRAEGDRQRLPLSLVTFVQSRNSDQAMIARITTAGDRNSSRRMNVMWNGKSVGEFDTASYFEMNRTFLVALPSREIVRNELRIQGEDGRRVRVKQITIAADGSADVQWTSRPKLAGGGSLRVLSAYYMPDPAPPKDSQAVEGRNNKQDIGLTLEGLQRIYKEYEDFGAIRVVLHNAGGVPVRIRDQIELNGLPLEDHYVDFKTSHWDARGVVWYRIRPQLVQPGGCSQVYIRFRRRPAGESASLTIHAENSDPVQVDVPYVDTGVLVDYVTVGKERDKLYVYARRSGVAPVKRVTGLTLDGLPLHQTKIYGGNFPGNVALLTAKLSSPLKVGNYHVVGVKTEKGRVIAAQFRVLGLYYPRSSIHVPSELCKQLHMNLGMWHERSPEECEQYNIGTTSYTPFSSNQHVDFVLGPDEPDAKDNRGGGTHANGLGWHARGLTFSGWQQLIERYAPQAASWIIMNGTVRPLNWAVYGQMADIACYDPYPVTYFAADHAYVRESLTQARRCGAPNRMHGCMEAFGWAEALGVPKGARGPIPAEYRQNIVQAIGTGMKGLTSWVHPGTAGGWQEKDAFREEIGRVNQLIEHIEGDLLLATPIDLASSDAGEVMTGVTSSDGTKMEAWPKQRVWTGTLLSGPDTIVVTAVNHIQAEKPDPPQIDVAKKVSITVKLPSYLKKVTGFEVTEDGVVPFDCHVENGNAILRLKAIESGRVFLLRRSE